MPQIANETVDVFTETRFGGNPLAVISDARGLSAEAMQRIAREFNYSESTFVLPPVDASNTARVRIFTPASESPVAGHPNVGTAFVLGRMGEIFGKPVGDEMRFEEGAGLVAIQLARRDGQVVGAGIQAPRDLEIGEQVEPAIVAACVSLQPSDIASERHAPVFASVGLEFVIAEVRSVDRLAKMQADVAAFRKAHQRHGGDAERLSLFVYSRLSPSRVRARMFAPLTNVPEDPATGSASAALGALLASLEKGGDAFQVTIEQGVEMGRPSLIHVRADMRDGRRRVTVTGNCVPVMRGTIAL